MSKTYLPYDPDQQLLLPAALQEWLPPDHLAYFISDVVDQLDLSAITARYEQETRGGPPYHPRMMVKVPLTVYSILRKEGLVKRSDIRLAAGKEYHRKTTGPFQMWATDTSDYKGSSSFGGSRL